MKNFLVFIILFLLIAPSVSAVNSTTASVEQVVVGYGQQINPVDYSFCVRTYQIHSAELFQRLLSAISSSNYKIIEIQSKSSRVLFSVWGKEFLAVVYRQSSNMATIKILPTDNNFYFKKEILDRIFEEIETNQILPLIRIEKR